MLKRNYLLVDLGHTAIDYEDGDKVKEVIYQIKVEANYNTNAHDLALRYYKLLQNNPHVRGLDLTVNYFGFDSNVVISEHITLERLLELLQIERLK